MQYPRLFQVNRQDQTEYYRLENNHWEPLQVGQPISPSNLGKKLVLGTIVLLKHVKSCESEGKA